MADTFDPASILSTLQSRARAAAAGTDPIALQYGNGSNPLAKFLPKEPKPEALPQLDVGDLQRQIAALERAQRSDAKAQKDVAGASLAGLADALTGATGGVAPATPGKLEQLFTPDMQWGAVVSSPQWKELPFAEQSRQRKLWIDSQISKVTSEAKLKPNDPRLADFRKRLETNTQIGEAPAFEWLNNDVLDAGIKATKDLISGVKLAFGGDVGEALDARRAAEADFKANASAKTLDQQKTAALRQRIAERDAGPGGLSAGQEASLAFSNFADAPVRNTVAQLPSTAGSLVGGVAGAAVGSLAGPGGTAAGFVAGSTATNAALTSGDVASGAAEAIDAMDEATLRKSDKFNALLQANNGDVGRAKKALTVAVAREAALLGAAVGAGEGVVEGMLPGVGKAAKGALKTGAADVVAEVGTKGIVAQALSKFGLVDASKNGALKKFAERVGKPTGDGLVRTVAGEAAQEFGAEYAGQVAQNLSVRDAGGIADQRLTEGAVGAGVTGALAGASTGGGAKVIGYGARKVGLGPRRDDNGDIYVTPVFSPDGNVTGVKRIGRKDEPGNVVVDEGTGLARLVDAAPAPAEDATPEDVARQQQQLAIDARTVASNNAAIFSRLGDAAGLAGGARDLFSAYATAFSLDQLNHPAGIALSDGSRADFTFGQNGEVNFVADENTTPAQRAEAERIEGTVNTALAAVIDPLSQYFSRVQNRLLPSDAAPVAPQQQPGDANAAQEGQVQQGDQQQREGAGAGLPQNGEDRNLSPIVGEGSPETGSGNSPVEGGAQPQGQEVAPPPAPVAQTPQPAPEPGMPESVGRWFSYGGIEGQLVRRQSGFYVVPTNNPEEAVFVEGGESGQPPSALGLTPYAQQPNPAAVAAGRARQDPTQLPAVAGAVSAANAPTSLDDRFNAAVDGLLALLGEDATADILAALDVPGQNFETLTKKVEAAYYEQLDAATTPAGQATPVPTDGGVAPNAPGPAAKSPGPRTAETAPDSRLRGGAAGSREVTDFLARAGGPGQTDNARLNAAEAVDTRSADRFPLAANVVALLENNNLSAALEELGRTEAPAYAALAKRLAPLLASTRVSVVDNLVDANGEPLYGDAASDGSDIRIDRAKGLTTETLLHEAIHAATERTLRAGTFQRTLNENVGVRELNSLWLSVKASGINMPGGSRDSLSEFVSEALTDAQFIAELDSYKWKASSFWETFKSALLRMLGFTPSTPYRATLMAADAIFRPVAGAPVQPPGGGGGPRLNRVTPGELVAQSRARVQSPPASVFRAVRQGLVPSIKQRSATAEVRQAGRTAAERINDAFADSLGPVVRWIDRLPSARQVRESLKGAMYAAPNIRDNLLQEAVEFHGGEQLRAALAEMAKASGRTVEDVVHYAGYWATARYAKIKNARMLQVAQDNLAQAQAALGAAQLAVPVDPNAVAGAQLAVDSAQAEVDARIAALNAPESATTHKVGLAGGFNNAQADAMMRVAERMFGAGKLQQMAQHLYRLNAFRMAMDIESGRTAPHLAAQFSPEMADALPEMLALRAAINGTQQQRERARKALIDKLAATSQYVPTTGDPAAGLDGDVLGTGFKTPNVAKDRRLTGRTETPADNGITASLAGLQRSASAAGWSRFTKGVADLYWSLTDAQREAAGMKATPLTALQRLGDNIVIHGDLGYSIGGADVMGALRKENVDDKSRFLEILSLPTRMFAYTATQLNPTFSVVNLVRDVWERSEFLRTRDLRLSNGRKVDSTRAARRMIALARDPQMLKDMLANQWTANKNGKYSTLLREFQEYGGGGSRYSEQFSPDRANLVSQIESAGSNLSGALRAIGRVVHKWNAAFDSVSSLAAYIALREQGMSREDAAAASLDLMNFRKAGASMPVVRAIYAFAQPAVTGGANLIRGLKTKEGRTRMMGYMVAFAFLHTLMASLSGDDEELGKNKIDLLDEYTRDKALPIPLGDGTVVKLPLGFGLPVFANTLMRIARDATAGDLTLDKVPGELVSRALTPQFSPIEDSKIEGDDKFLQRFYNTFAPTILKPSANVAMNTTGFGGEIVKKQYQDPTKFQSEQGSPMTPETYGEIAVFVRKHFGLDFAPEQVRELMKGYSLGGMRHLLNYSIENPHREAMGMETNMPVVSGIVSGYNANALLGEFNRFEQQASKLLKRKSAEEELDAQEEQVLALYTSWLELDKELRKEQAALTRAGVPKGLDPARSAIRERRNLYQAALVRQFNLLQEQQ